MIRCSYVPNYVIESFFLSALSTSHPWRLFLRTSLASPRNQSIHLRSPQMFQILGLDHQAPLIPCHSFPLALRLRALKLFKPLALLWVYNLAHHIDQQSSWHNYSIVVLDQTAHHNELGVSGLVSTSVTDDTIPVAHVEEHDDKLPSCDSLLQNIEYTGLESNPSVSCLPCLLCFADDS